MKIYVSGCTKMMKTAQKKWIAGTGSGARDYTLYGMLYPIVLELIFAYICSSINQMILNRFSPQAIAATTAVGTFSSLMLTTFAVFYAGQSILLAPCWGRKEYEEGRQILTVGLIDNILLGLLLAAIWFGAGNFIMRMIHVPSDLWAMSGDYLSVVLGLSVFQGITATFATAFRAIGNMKTAMAGSCLINGSWILWEALILWLVPAGRQNISLYALAAILAHILGGIFYIRRAAKDKDIRLKFFRSNWRSRFRATTGQIMRLGIFSGMESVIYVLSQTIVVSMIGALGTQALLVKGYTANLINYIILPASSIPIVASTLIGISLGMRDEERLIRYFRQSVRLVCAATVALEVIALLIGRSFFAMYTDDPQILDQCMVILKAEIAMELFRCIASLIIACLKAIGDVRMPFFMVIAGSLINIGASWLFGIRLGLGLPGIWIGYAADLAFRSLLSYLIWKKHVKNHSYPVWK